MNIEELKIWLAAIGILSIGGWMGYFFCWGMLKVKGLI
jgi:hypothetical protein